MTEVGKLTLLKWNLIPILSLWFTTNLYLHVIPALDMEFLDTTILVGVIAAIATVLSATIPYCLGKRNEREDNIRERKISSYD